MCSSSAREGVPRSMQPEQPTPLKRGQPAAAEHRPTDLFAELKRRKVYRVGAAYLAGVFAALEGADMVFPVLGAATIIPLCPIPIGATRPMTLVE